MSAEAILGLLGLLVGVLTGVLLGRRRRTPTPAPTPAVVPPPPPSATAVEHQLEHEISTADIVDEVAAETGIPAHEIDELVQLADDNRRR